MQTSGRRLQVFFSQSLQDALRQSDTVTGIRLHVSVDNGEVHSVSANVKVIPGQLEAKAQRHNVEVTLLEDERHNEHPAFTGIISFLGCGEDRSIGTLKRKTTTTPSTPGPSVRDTRQTGAFH